MRMPMLVFMALVLASTAAPAANIVDEEYLAMESTGELYPPPAVVTRIAADLAAARSLVPALENVHVFPEWIPGHVFVDVTQEAYDRFLAGEHEGLNLLNEQLQIHEVRVSESFTAFTFISRYPFYSLLAEKLYEEVDGVVYASASGYGGDGDDIDVIGDRLYLFRMSWEDCPAGCLYDHYWEIQVDDGGATVVDEYGDPLTTPTLESSWGKVKARYAE